MGQSLEQLSLAKELLDDVELSRRTPEQLVLKATRLARLVGDDTAQAWLEPERRGYYRADALKAGFGRVTDPNGPKGY